MPKWTHDAPTSTLHLELHFCNPDLDVPRCRASLARDREQYRPGSGTHDLYTRLLDALNEYQHRTN